MGRRRGDYGVDETFLRHVVFSTAQGLLDLPALFLCSPQIGGQMGQSWGRIAENSRICRGGFAANQSRITEIRRP